MILKGKIGCPGFPADILKDIIWARSSCKRHSGFSTVLSGRNIMAKQINRTMIGVFVVMAIGILTASVVLFGSGDLFKESIEYVLYFEESVKGLNVGSPVLYRGFPVGEVKRVVILADPENSRDAIQVFVEIYPKSVVVMKQKMQLDEWKERMAYLIERGLRAQLVPQSLITGQLLIELDTYPDTPIVLKNSEERYQEIPTIPSSLSKIQTILGKIDLEEINDRLISILQKTDRILGNPNIDGSLNELAGALSDARGLMQHVDTKVDPLATAMTDTLNSADAVFKRVDGQVDPLATAVTEALASADMALKSIDGLVGQRSPTRADLDKTLTELAEAARSLRVLTDYLEQHPEALLMGKDNQRY